ncbi:MAG: isochorismatase family protein [Alphaproteobacteria bacterium]
MRTIRLAARPEPLPIARETTALIVNDMQNAFCSKGGYLDRVGFDISGAEAVVEKVERVLAAARAAGVAIIHAQNGFSKDLREIPETSPWWLKSPALRHMRAHPELAGQLLTEGTWDFAFVDRLAPRAGEIVIRKTRPSGFARTSLDAQLIERGVKTLVVIGIASNVGVEWTLREAMSREYFGVLIEDASMQAGPPEIHRAVVYNVETFIGWVATVAAFEAACRALAAK